MSQREPAILVLRDGTVFRGTSIGSVAGIAAGEVVFNTAMTGYQEILTDPSYCRQIVTLTYPHIGNTGTNPEDVESGKVYAAGLVIRDLPLLASSWRKTQDLPAYLREQDVVADRRHRYPQAHAHPARKGRAGRLPHGGQGRRKGRAQSRAQTFRVLAGMDLAKVVSCTKTLCVDRIDVDARPGLRPADGADVPCRRLRLRRQAQHPAHAGGARATVSP